MRHCKNSFRNALSALLGGVMFCTSCKKDSGITGDCTWTLTDDYTLTIAGNGAMGNYSNDDKSPWYRYDIKASVIRDGVTTVGDYAFAECTGLTSVTIPNSVTSIGDWAFFECTDLTSVTIPNSVTTIGDGAFDHCYGLTSVSIPNSVTAIGDGAFMQCSGMTSVNIPNSVTTIGEWAFSDCRGLTSVNIPNSVTTIDDAAFESCSSLTSVSIPNSVTAIGNWAFIRCSSLTSVTIPNSVITIGNEAFSGCDSLSTVTIPNSVTTIGYHVFDCSGLTYLNVDAANMQYSSENGVLFNKDKTTLICCPAGKTGSYAIPNSVTTIGDGAFIRCSGLTSVSNLNPTPQEIYSNVFSDVNISALTLKVPASAVDAYKAAPVWKEFGKIIAVSEEDE